MAAQIPRTNAMSEARLSINPFLIPLMTRRPRMQKMMMSR
jgi:hypothetical protein